MPAPASAPADNAATPTREKSRWSWLRITALGVLVAGPIAVVGSVFMLSAPDTAIPEAKAAPMAAAAVARQKRAAVAITEGKSGAIVARGESAKDRNELIKFAGVPVEPMRGFSARIPSANAERCLTEAVYYEAGFEPEAGKRGVAQVVLNRVRHPAYPNSVCGVVYQGVNRPVCQFSFTCDGSLSRRPAAGAWAAAARIAKDALAGQVEKSVGTATHYHADYVVPRWAYTLGKVTKLGSHIFYRFNGRVGGARAFTAMYSANETIPTRRAALVETAVVESIEPVLDTYENGLTVAPDIKDRHAPSDIGGRIDTTKSWRLDLPIKGSYKETVAAQGSAPAKGNGGEIAQARPVTTTP